MFYEGTAPKWILNSRIIQVEDMDALQIGRVSTRPSRLIVSTRVHALSGWLTSRWKNRSRGFSVAQLIGDVNENGKELCANIVNH